MANKPEIPGSEHNLTRTHNGYLITYACKNNNAIIGQSLCFDDDGYTHDAQCVIYNGPDEDYQGQEICFNSNEND